MEQLQQENAKVSDGRFVLRSLQLQSMLMAAGYSKRGHVTAEGCTLVRRIAKCRELRDWPHTRTVEDYDALIEAVNDHLSQNQQIRTEIRRRRGE